jgi:Tol biopolymer transport system component
LANDAAQLVSVRQDGGSAGYGLWATVPAISPDGNNVLFECADDGLVSDDNNRASDVFLRDLVAEVTDLVSVRQPELPALMGTGISWIEPNCVSADGKTILFTSFDNNFYELDTNSVQDIWLRNMSSNSVQPLNQPLRLAYGGDHPQYQQMGAPYITADGRYATYAWGGHSATEYVEAGIYRQELGGTNFDVVTNINNDASSPRTSRDPKMFPFSLMTSDGRFVIVQAIGFSSSNIYVKDMKSASYYAPTALEQNIYYRFGSTHPIISPNDRWILFFSDLHWRTYYSQDYGTNYYYDYRSGSITVYAMDLPAYVAAVDASSNTFVNPRQFTRTLKSVYASPSQDYATNAVFSPNSRYVAFHNSDLIIYRHDLLAPSNAENIVVCTNCMSPSMSGDGRFVVYEVPRSPLVNDIYVKDLETGEAQLVSVNRNGTAANGNSTAAQISFDARYIVFSSRASNLGENDNNHLSDIFVRDRVRGVTMLLSANLAGTGSGNSSSANPILAADGRTVVFQSFATDFAPGSYYDTRNIFTVRLGGSDTDQDGLEDDWELAYFGDLSRDGTGDYDQDGLTDLQEFTTGTDPTNVGSVFRAYTVTASGGNTTVFWSAVPGKIYRVEYKDNIEDANWTELSTATAGGTTGSALDATPNTSHRFYRVVLAQ